MIRSKKPATYVIYTSTDEAIVMSPENEVAINLSMWVWLPLLCCRCTSMMVKGILITMIGLSRLSAPLLLVAK